MRQLSLLDQFICEVDVAFRTLLTPQVRQSIAKNPAEGLPDATLTPQEQRHVAGLMRVNHAGEVSAQALYQGQAMTAKLPTVKAQMTQAALEEVCHLAWCEQRLRELGSHPSVLNPIWYFGSLALGAIAGLAGDKWSLGFVEETERQVTHHLEQHLECSPPQDLKTKAILTKMQQDESAHADIAQQAGAAILPVMLKRIMAGVSKLMTVSSYYV